MSEFYASRPAKNRDLVRSGRVRYQSGVEFSDLRLDVRNSSIGPFSSELLLFEGAVGQSGSCLEGRRTRSSPRTMSSEGSIWCRIPRPFSTTRRLGRRIDG